MFFFFLPPRGVLTGERGGGGELYRATEDFSYFTLRRRATATRAATSVFGISCTRQIGAKELVNRPPDVTRSTVQKAVVVVAHTPRFFGQIREKLSMVTGAWFAQRYWGDVSFSHTHSLPPSLSAHVRIMGNGC